MRCRSACPAVLALVGLTTLVAACQKEDSSTCGDGWLDRGETCDGSALDGQTCEGLDQGFHGGALACNPTCDGWDTSFCVQDVCGDGVASGEELCDGDDLRGNGCLGLGLSYDHGFLFCNPTCDGWITDWCEPQGTGTIRIDAYLGYGVTCDATDPDRDCVGRIIAVVSAGQDGSDPVAVMAAEERDLRVQGGFGFHMEDVPAGSWRLTIFLDDDGTADASAPQPASGDLVGRNAQYVWFDNHGLVEVTEVFDQRRP